MFDRGSVTPVSRQVRSLPDMAGAARSALASAIGWLIVAIVAIWLFGLVAGWIGFVLRSVGWLLLIGALVVAYLAIKAPPDD